MNFKKSELTQQALIFLPQFSFLNHFSDNFHLEVHIFFSYMHIYTTNV